MGDPPRRQGKQPVNNKDDGEVKFYVTNIPDKCSGKDLDDLLQEFGAITKIYIARKRDREGRRFGFVRFRNVKDKLEMERSMRNLWLGSYKLRINVARFIGGDEGRKTTEETRKEAELVFAQKCRSDQMPVGGRNKASFRDILTGQKIENKEEVVVNIVDEINENSDRHGRSLVATLVDIDKLKKVGDLFRDLNPSGGEIQFLGGLLVLLTFKDSEEAEEVRKKAAVRVDFFYSIETWEGQSFPFERVAWLKIQGIPLNLLCNDTLNMVGNRFSKVIYKAKVQKESGDLSYEYVGVLVGDGRRIMDEVVLQWKQKRFRIWVMEEIGDWLPDFLLRNAGSMEDKSDHRDTGM